MIRTVITLALAGCAHRSPPTPKVPTCADLVEHSYAVSVAELIGDDAIAARRAFTRVRPRLIERCEAHPPSPLARDCVIRATTAAALTGCGSRD